VLAEMIGLLTFRTPLGG